MSLVAILVILGCFIIACWAVATWIEPPYRTPFFVLLIVAFLAFIVLKVIPRFG